MEIRVLKRKGRRRHKKRRGGTEGGGGGGRMGHMSVMGRTTLFIGHKRTILLLQAKGNEQDTDKTQTKHR